MLFVNNFRCAKQAAIRSVFRLLLSIVFVAISRPVAASEGLFLFDSAPKLVQDIWPSVFMLLSETPESMQRGTAFVVQRIDHQNQTELVFVTAAHNLANPCRSTGACPFLNLYQDARYDVTTEGIRRIRTSRKPLRIEIVRISIEADLAVLRATYESLSPDIRPLRLPATCQFDESLAAYAIGFPNTSLREVAEVPVVNPNQIVKRWAHGRLFAGLYEDATPMSIDGLDGFSGAPVFNAAGEVYGVYRGVRADKASGFAYFESPAEGATVEDHYSTAMTCEALKKILAQ